MMRLRHKLLIHAFRLFDQFILIGTLLVLIAIFREHGSFGFLLEVYDSIQATHNALAGALLLLGWVAIFDHVVRYDANRFTPLSSNIRNLVKATAGAAFLLFLVDAAFSISLLNNIVIALFWLVSSLLGIATRVALRALLKTFRRSGYNCRYVVFVGTNPRAVDFAKRVEARPELGYRIGGFVTEDQPPAGNVKAEQLGWPVLGTVSQFQGFLRMGTVDEVMLCLPLQEHFKEIYQVIHLCKDLGVVVRVLPEVPDVQTFAGSQLEMFDGDCVITFFRENLLWQLLIKRTMDLVLSAIMLIIGSPILITTAILIKLTSPGPVFFVQERMGMNKRKFKLFKFRSMAVDAEKRKAELAALNEQEGPVFKIKNDPRVTPVGRWIRKTSIDELPQLFNVIKGEMSLVGPRPPLPTEVEQYDWVYRRRLSIKPGLTCLWQVSGRNNIPFARWMELDREYIDNWSIWLDIRILLKTIPVVLFARGAS